MVALQGRQVDVSAMRAVGYGEGVPVADNGNEAGREANRRIEFTLIDAPTVAAANLIADKSADGTLLRGPSAGGTTSGAAADASFAPTTRTARPKTRPKG